MQSSGKRYKVQATEMPVQRIQGCMPEYNEPQTIMKLHAFKSSLVIVCPQEVECACETLSTQTPHTPPPPSPNRALSGACFPCLLAHVFGPCMVLHKATQARFYMFF